MRPRLELLARDEIEAIHDATFELLEKHGVKVLDLEAQSIFANNGAEVDPKTGTVRIPRDLTKKEVREAPREFTIYGRESGKEVHIGDGSTVLSSVGTSVQVLDLDGNLRGSLLKDVSDSFRLLDFLPNIRYASWTVWPRDVPQELGHAYEIREGFINTTKPFDGYTWGTRCSLETIELALAVAGDKDTLRKKPMLLGFANPVSPLTLSKEPTQGILVYARYGQPLVFPPECQAGGTAPATLAGLLVQQSAEVLASVVLAQLVNPGTPVLYGTVSTIMDMKTGNIALGAPEAGLLGAASVQIAHAYGLPCRATGGNTDSLYLDYQAGSETSMTALMPALAGAEFIYDAAGSLESSLTMSYEKLVLDNEICGALDRILDGIAVDADRIALDVVASIGPGETYLSKPHTLRHFRHEHFVPTLFNRLTRNAGPNSTKEDVVAKANKMARRILAEHSAPPLPGDVIRDLNQSFEGIRARYYHRQSHQSPA
jgi:trimethylamine--corrinoid protein Co-methyltransferase